jgi:hypothetical protein
VYAPETVFERGGLALVLGFACHPQQRETQPQLSLAPDFLRVWTAKSKKLFHALEQVPVYRSAIQIQDPNKTAQSPATSPAAVFPPGLECLQRDLIQAVRSKNETTHGNPDCRGLRNEANFILRAPLEKEYPASQVLGIPRAP